MKRRLLNLLPPLPLVLPAVVSGVLLTLCFPPFSVWPLCFVALVPLFVGLLRVRPRRKDSFKTVFLYGFVFYVTLMWWVARLLPSAGATLPWILVPATVIIALYLSLYPALGFVLVAALTRYRFVAFVTAAPAVWAVADLARSQGELSFPWGAIGYALSDTPSLIQSASAFGLSGLTYLIVLVNALVSGAFVYRRTRVRALSFVAALLVVVGMWGLGQREIGRLEAISGTDTTVTTVRTAIVQPNVDLAVKWKPEFKDSTLSLIDRLTRDAAALDADFIVFPETSAPVYIDGRIKTFKRRLLALSSELDAWIFIGFLNHGYDGPNGEVNIYNSSGLFAPDGRLDKYDKNHLLPFGEQLPLSWKFRWLRKVDFGQSNFVPGPAQPPFQAAGLKFTPLICFESVFSYLCRRGVQQGSQLLVNITNDGWFGNTPGARQHAQMCILRAVEFRRYLVRSANSGVSWVVDPTGSVVMSLGLYQQGLLTFDVPAMDGKTIYCRFGDWPLLIWSVALAVVAAFVSRRRRPGD
jgi:apolipoprotein N-acyltransferase